MVYGNLQTLMPFCLSLGTGVLVMSVHSPVSLLTNLPSLYVPSPPHLPTGPVPVKIYQKGLWWPDVHILGSFPEHPPLPRSVHL